MTRPASLIGALALASAATIAAPASASAPPLAVSVPSALPLAAIGMREACAPFAVPASTTPTIALAPRPASKSAAILGGQMSALERMRLQQQGLAAPALAAAPAAAVAAPLVVAAPVLPRLSHDACAGSDALSPRLAFRIPAPAPAASATGAFLGSERVAIGRTRFDSQWDRVAAGRLSRLDLVRTIGQVPRQRARLLSRVNRWVNTRIAYRSDRQLDGRRDYWADAPTTLRRGAGDCEDFAILKMQMLAAAGIPREDMMLTLARDTMRRLDHAVLLVRDGTGWVMLDMQSDKVVPAAADYGYRAVMSFSAEGSWLHGQAVTPRPTYRLASAR